MELEPYACSTETNTELDNELLKMIATDLETLKSHRKTFCRIFPKIYLT